MLIVLQHAKHGIGSPGVCGKNINDILYNNSQHSGEYREPVLTDSPTIALRRTLASPLLHGSFIDELAVAAAKIPCDTAARYLATQARLLYLVNPRLQRRLLAGANHGAPQDMQWALPPVKLFRSF